MWDLIRLISAVIVFLFGGLYGLDREISAGNGLQISLISFLLWMITSVCHKAISASRYAESIPHRPSRGFREEDLARRNSYERRSVRRNLDFQDVIIPEAEDVVREAQISHGNENIPRETDQFNHGGVTCLVAGRGQGRSGSGNRGHRGFYRGGSRSGRSSSFKRREAVNGVHRSALPVGGSPDGRGTEKSRSPSKVQVSEKVGDGAKKIFNSVGTLISEPDHITAHSKETLADVEDDNRDDTREAKDPLEDGEVNEIGNNDVYNGELEDFTDFDGDFEFGLEGEVGNEIGENELIIQEETMMGHLEYGESSLVGAVENQVIFNEVDASIVEKDMGVGEMVIAEAAIKENVPVVESENQVMRDGTKKQTRSSGPLVRANSKKRNVALLTSPRRKVPPKAGVGVKIGGKDKNGKVALPKLPGRP